MNTIVEQSQARLSLLATPPKPLYWTVPGLPMRIPCSTPYRMAFIITAILIANVFFFFAATHAVDQCRIAIKSVGLDCAPSIVAAQAIRTDLADLDANLFNQLLTDPASKDGKTAEKIAATRHKQVSEHLVDAAKNITFGEKERLPIVAMVTGLGRYETLMATARALQQKGDLGGTVAASRQASSLMHDTIIDAADALDKANSDVLESTYTQHQSSSRFALGNLIVVGILLLGLMAFAQFHLLRKTHRLLNVGLLASTVAALFILGKTSFQVIDSGKKLDVAVNDAFASVHYLWKARAIGYDANGEESRYLFEKDHDAAMVHQRQFWAKTSDIARVPANLTLESVADAASAARKLPSEFTGLLANELGNITFDGERPPAVKALRSFSKYLAVDKKIRDLEEKGRHAEAITLCLSDVQGGSNHAFEEFDKAILATKDVNQTEFDKAVKTGLDALDSAGWTIALSTLLIAAGTIAGFWPRMKEYE